VLDLLVFGGHWSVALMPTGVARILIVDDEPGSVGLLLAYLGRQDVDPMVALDALDALAKADAGLPDLILLDVSMPGIDGFETCRRLKAARRTASIPVIFLSAKSSTEDKLEGFAAGGVDYIGKPFSEDEVVARVLVHLAVRRRLQQLEAMATTRALERLPNQGRLDAADFFDRACAILEQRLVEPPGLQDLARQVGTNERRLNALFKQRVGLTVFDYLLELRLGQARRLLEASTQQVQQIADSVGYRNAGDFTRAFTRRFGASPRQYRQQMCRIPDDGIR
jgi:DNA-binding response OmpR family regulator